MTVTADTVAAEEKVFQIAARVRELIEQGVTDSDTIAETVLPEILSSTSPFDILFPMIRSHVEVTRRALVRAMENQAWMDREDTGESSPPAPSNPAMRGRPDFSGLLNAMVTIRVKGQPTREVPWGKMTVQDHKDRIEMLETIIAGNFQTVLKHQEAIRIIQADGVSCLEQCYF